MSTQPALDPSPPNTNSRHTAPPPNIIDFSVLRHFSTTLRSTVTYNANGFSFPVTHNTRKSTGSHSVMSRICLGNMVSQRYRRFTWLLDRETPLTSWTLLVTRSLTLSPPILLVQSPTFRLRLSLVSTPPLSPTVLLSLGMWISLRLLLLATTS